MLRIWTHGVKHHERQRRPMEDGDRPEWRPVAAEAWRRVEAGELADDGLYPAEAAWVGASVQMLGYGTIQIPDAARGPFRAFLQEIAAIYDNPGTGRFATEGTKTREALEPVGVNGLA